VQPNVDALLLTPIAPHADQSADRHPHDRGRARSANMNERDGSSAFDSQAGFELRAGDGIPSAARTSP
jgi:NAD kinase